jgi:hypothetical protein
MKKQLLIAAVAATMATASIADVSITGSGKLNFTNTDTTASSDGTTVAGSTANAFSTDLILQVVGKNGDTSVHFKEEFNDANGTDGMNTKNAYMKSKIGDVNVQAGSWYSADSLLANGTGGDGKFSADYTFEGVKVQFEDANANGNSSFTLSGEVAGVTLSHEFFVNDNTDTKISGSVAGLDLAYRAYDVDTASGTTQDKESFEASYTINGITLDYANVNVDSTGTTTSDAFFGTQASAVGDMTGVGVKTDLAGNTVQLRSYTINPTNAAGSTDDDYIKMIVTRPLASGSTFEMTYTDKNAGAASIADTKTLDLELSVKF